jgi:DNA-binding MarR family transcriptional regulator
MFHIVTRPTISRQPRTSYLVARLDRLIRSRLADALKPFDVSVTQYTLMSVLDHRPGLSNAQLARRSYITAQAMHQMVNTLEDRGLIERTSSPDHGRIQLTELTGPGRHLLRRCDQVVEGVESAVFGGLDSDETTELRRLLEECIVTDRGEGP